MESEITKHMETTYHNAIQINDTHTHYYDDEELIVQQMKQSIEKREIIPQNTYDCFRGNFQLPSQLPTYEQSHVIKSKMDDYYRDYDTCQKQKSSYDPRGESDSRHLTKPQEMAQTTTAAWDYFNQYGVALD